LFTIYDFFKLLKYFKTGETKDLDPNLIIHAEDSKGKASTLFDDSIDLMCHSSDDYKRLKKFFIPWYTSLRTFNSTMAKASEARSLPEDHLNILLNSFGYSINLDQMTKSNKVDFLYDLVNLYKIKGTPESIGRALSFYGISDIELFEYYLQYDEEYNLIFRPSKVIYDPDYSTTTSSDINLNDMIRLDPHWMLSADQINELFLRNRIAFPSKSPYYGIRPILTYSGNKTTIPSLALLFRHVQDYYNEYKSGTTLTKDLLLTFLRIEASMLDLYLGIIYLMHLLYYKDHDSSDLSFLIYNGPLTKIDPDTGKVVDRTFDEICDEYENLTRRVIVDPITELKTQKTREQLAIDRNTYNGLYSRLRTTNFLVEWNTAKDILTKTNPDLKLLIESYYGDNKGVDTLKYLLGDLTQWIKFNISPLGIDLASFMLGFAALDYLTEVINFFKPYRARMCMAENLYIIKDSVGDGIVPEDEFGPTTVIDKFIDWDTADSKPCGCCSWEGHYLHDLSGYDWTCNPCLDSTAFVYYSRETYDCGSYFDIGASMCADKIDGGLLKDDPEIYVIHTINDVYNYHKDWHHFLAAENGNFLSYTQPATITGVEIYEAYGYSGNYNLSYNYLHNTLSFSGNEAVQIIDSTSLISYTLEDSTSHTIINLKIQNSENLPTKDTTDIIYLNFIDTTSLEDHLIICENDNKIISYNQYEQYVSNKYKGNITGEEYFHLQDGGWTNFDSGGVFDAPAISDVCEVYVSSA
jgi:hypothetical protein